MIPEQSLCPWGMLSLPSSQGTIGAESSQQSR